MLDKIFKFLESISQNKNWKEQFDHYFNVLVEYNKKINLTRIDNYEDFYIKHIYNSAMCLKNNEISGLNIFDIGTGAGFPGIVWKILIPNIKLTLIESTNKKCNFLKTAVQELNLKDVEIIYGRAEELAFKFNEKADIVTARAVATLPILLELTSRFSKVSSNLFLFKGAKYKEELKISQRILNELNLEVIDIIQDDYLDDSNYVILNFKKVKSTPKNYPRSFHKIKNIPI